MDYTTIPVIESMEIPKNLRDIIIQLYVDNDHRGVPNDSYTRYPYGFDLDDGIKNNYCKVNDFDKFLIESLGHTPPYIIIHWDW